jgi:hypothetical protein
VIDQQSCMLEVLDTAGQEEYTALRDQWIRDGEGFVLVYSISSRASFARIEKFHHQIQRVKESAGAGSPTYPGSPLSQTPHKRAAPLRNSSTANLLRRRRRTASTWKRRSSTSCDNCASNEQVHHHPAIPRAIILLRARATVLQRIRTTTTTERRSLVTVGHGRTESADPSVLSYDRGFISTRVHQEFKVGLSFGVVQAPCVSCTVPTRVSPAASVGRQRSQEVQPRVT